MKLFKILLVALILLVNLVVVNPSEAEPSMKFLRNPDYIETTKALNELMAKDVQGATPEQVQEIQKQIANLQFQKYAIETGENWGQCFNGTGRTLAIYGHKSKKSLPSAPNMLYFLANGQATDDEWDCEGVYVPSDVAVAGLDLTEGQERGPIAFKVTDGTQVMVMTNPATSQLEFNITPTTEAYNPSNMSLYIPGFAQASIDTTKVYKPGQSANWYIPNLSQTNIDMQFPNAPIND